MSTEKAPVTVTVTVTDLVEEAKKRIVLLTVCVVGLSYLMSLTSSSVLVNLPAAAFLIIILRYFALDFDNRRKSAAYNSKPALANINFQKKYEAPKLVTRNSEWRRKVNSPAVEDALDHFSRHLVSEWVTDLWYSRITPDRQAPEELVRIINGVLAEIACRMRNIDLIDFLTRDIIKLFCVHLEVFRVCHVKIQKRQMGSLTIGQRDIELKYVLAAQNKLHPALFSTDAEHKVLQHLMEGLVSLTFKPDDLHCSLFRYIVRELLSCAVMRPVLNLANPRFINERIEGVALSLKKADKVVVVAQQVKSSESPKISTVQISRSQDPSVKGVELMQVKKDQPNSSTDNIEAEEMNGGLSKDPLLSIGTQSTRSWSFLPVDSQSGDGRSIQRHPSGGEWGDKLDVIARRKTEALAPEHFENMWAKGRNYKKKEGADNSALPVQQSTSVGLAKPVDDPKSLSKYLGKAGAEKVIAAKDPGAASAGAGGKKLYSNDNWSNSGHPGIASYEEDNEDSVNSDDVESGSSSSYPTDDENSNITGLDTPSIKVWDGRNNRNQSVTRIHHPLEISKGHKARKTSKGRVQSQRLLKSQSGRKKSRSGSQISDVWQEVERTSVSMEGQDILKPSIGQVKSDGSSGNSETESLGRTNSGATASSSLSFMSIPESHSLALNTPVSSLLADSFLTLRCEVVCANIVKSGSSTFAVYSISVTDVENKSWSIKRRFRHFEELHRRLKEYPEYTFHLPPKHFLSTGLDVPVIRERCKLLDAYLKKLLQLPTISGSIEVWDFLSVDSQTYSFSDSISIIETLSDDTSYEKKKEIATSARDTRHIMDQFSPKRELQNSGMKESVPQMRINHVTDLSRMNTMNAPPIPPERPAKAFGKPLEDSSKKIDKPVQDKIPLDSKLGATVKEAEIYQSHPAAEPHMDDGGTDPALPSDWIPPNLCAPILDLVDVLFQLHDGGWIRRKAFWVAKQVLQLGMGDAFDDWLIEKIQILRRGSVVASGIRRVEQILWPDGIFLTKHPKRQRPTPSASSNNSSQGQSPAPLPSPKEDDIRGLDELQEKEARRREQFVYELMIDNAPATLVGLVGRKEYDHCAKDLYYFLQSSVCLKQLAYGLLELLLLSAFPELENVFRQLHEEKDKFGELKQS